MRRCRGFAFGISSMAAVLISLLATQALACVLASPPSCQATESDQTCLERSRAWYAAEETARIALEKKSPSERALIEQDRLWDDHEIIFLARIDKIRLRGKVFPQREPKAVKSQNGKRPSPPIPLPVPAFRSHGERYEAYIRPLRQIKGATAFAASWQEVGGMTTCGSSTDGALAFSSPGDEIIIFANWAIRSRMVRGKWVSSDYLSLYGVDREGLVEPRILALIVSKADMVE